MYWVNVLVKAKDEQEARAIYDKNREDFSKTFDHSNEDIRLNISKIRRADTKEAQDSINLIARNYGDIYIIGEPSGYDFPEHKNQIALYDKRLNSSEYFLLN
jgi:hypothetical protein